MCPKARIDIAPHPPVARIVGVPPTPAGGLLSREAALALRASEAALVLCESPPDTEPGSLAILNGSWG